MLPAGLKFSVAVADWSIPPYDPVIVNVKLPVCAVLVVVTVKVEDPDPVTLGGLKVPLAPDPKPVALKETVPLDPAGHETDTV